MSISNLWPSFLFASILFWSSFPKEGFLRLENILCTVYSYSKSLLYKRSDSGKLSILFLVKPTAVLALLPFVVYILPFLYKQVLVFCQVKDWVAFPMMDSFDMRAVSCVMVTAVV